MTNPVIKTAFLTKLINLATTITLPTELFSHNFAEMDVWSRPVASVTVECCPLSAGRCSFPPLAPLCLRDAAFFSVDSIDVISFTTSLRLNSSLPVVFAWLTRFWWHWLVDHGDSHWDWSQIHSMWRDSLTLRCTVLLARVCAGLVDFICTFLRYSLVLGEDGFAQLSLPPYKIWWLVCTTVYTNHRSV